MWFIGVEVEQETSAPRPKKILNPHLLPFPKSGNLYKSTDCSVTDLVRNNYTW